MGLDSRDEDNRVRCRRTPSVGHVESHFLKANSPDGQRAIWLKHTAFVSDSPLTPSVGEVWAIAFERDRAGFPVGAKESYSLSDVEWRDRPFAIEAPGATLKNGSAVGQADSAEHRLRWELALAGDEGTLRPFPWARMYDGKFPKSKTLTPYPNARADGFVEVDGERWDLDGWPSMQGHNWGRGHADQYAWVHANLWHEGAEAWFEGLTGRVALGPILTPWLSLAALRLEGKLYRFDGLPALLSRHGVVSARSWSFSLRGPRARLEGRANAATPQIAGLHYPNPDGSMTYCLNSKLADLELRLHRPGRDPVDLRSATAALEIGTKDPAHGMRMIL